NLVMGFEHGNGEPVLKINLGRLRCHLPTKTGTTMIGQAFQIDRVGKVQQYPGFARAGAATQHNKFLALDQLLKAVDQESAKGLVAAFDQWVVNSGILDSLLRQP